MKNVRNNAMPTRTWLGGDCWVAMAWRRNPNTTMMRVKEVVMTRIAGASEMTVTRSTTIRDVEIFCGAAAFWIPCRRFNPTPSLAC